MEILSDPLLNVLLSSASLVLGFLINRSIKTPRDHQRAEHLSRIAREAAALLVTERKGDRWSVLLGQLVTNIITSGASPTTNRKAVERAAAAALRDMGVAAS